MNLMSYFSVELKHVPLITAASNKIQSSHPEFQIRRNERQRTETVQTMAEKESACYKKPVGIRSWRRLQSKPRYHPSPALSDQKSRMKPWISDTDEKNNAWASGASKSHSSGCKWRRWQRSCLNWNASPLVHAKTSDITFHPLNANAMFLVWSRHPQEVYAFEQFRRTKNKMQKCAGKVVRLWVLFMLVCGSSSK